MLLFEEDIQERQEITAAFLQAQAIFGLGDLGKAEELLRSVLARDPNHQFAADLLETNNEKTYEKLSD